jgi:N-methylhydantoinase A
MAAVFSAFGIAFSDIGKTYEVELTELTTAAAQQVHDTLVARAERDMFQEGYALGDCDTSWQLTVEDAAGAVLKRIPYAVGEPVPATGARASLQLTVTARLPHPDIRADVEVPVTPIAVTTTRQVRSAADTVDEVPVHVLTELAPGAGGSGPALIEGPFFTARVLPGWDFRVTAAGDLFLTDTL